MIAPLLPLRSRNSYGVLSTALAIRGNDDDIHGSNAATPEVTIAPRRVRRGEDEDFPEDSSDDDDDDNDNDDNDNDDLDEEEVVVAMNPTAK